MKRKIKHKVIVNKQPNGAGYSVFEMTFDVDGSTVNHCHHGNNLSFKEAHALKREILECYA